jgi:hypothetical protein
MSIRRLLLGLIACCCLFAVGAVLPDGAQPVSAQEGEESDILLSLKTDTTDMETGQEYEVEIWIENATDIWTVDMEIAFDPDLLFIFGTKAGSPVKYEQHFEPDSVTTVRNLVEYDQLTYVMSRLGLVDPMNGDVLLGVFRIYPIAPGQTSLSFLRADMVTVAFEGEGMDRVRTDISRVSFTPVMVELSITGDPVDPPDEATATPTLTPTLRPDEGGQRPGEGEDLENVTAAPQAEETEEAGGAGQSAGLPLPLVIGIVVMVIGAVGLIVLLVSRRMRAR